MKVGDKIEEQNSGSVEVKDVPRTLTESPPPAKPIHRRFVFVDGLRGIAALAVMIFHIWWYEPQPYALHEAHWVFDAALIRTRGAVQILLVISGFVIGLSMRRVWVTPGEILNFVGRRLIRLIPPYYVTIAVLLLVDFACRHFWALPSPFEEDVTLVQLLAHMTFLQDILGYEAFGAGFWATCIEVQFYFCAIILWGIAQRLFRRPNPTQPTPSVLGLITVFAPIAFISLFHWRILESTEPWVTHFAWMFFLGMVAWWTYDRSLPRGFFWVVVAIALVELVIDAEKRYENSVALMTAISLYLVGIYNRQGDLLNFPWLQYVGKISYSLYLIHFPVCHVISSTGWKLCNDAPTKDQAFWIHSLCLVASLIAASILYYLVEVPSLHWAARLKREPSAVPS